MEHTLLKRVRFFGLDSGFYYRIQQGDYYEFKFGVIYSKKDPTEYAKAKLNKALETRSVEEKRWVLEDLSLGDNTLGWANSHRYVAIAKALLLDLNSTVS